MTEVAERSDISLGATRRLVLRVLVPASDGPEQWAEYAKELWLGEQPDEVTLAESTIPLAWDEITVFFYHDGDDIHWLARAVAEVTADGVTLKPVPDEIARYR